jgi:hypothetical protein
MALFSAKFHLLNLRLQRVARLSRIDPVVNRAHCFNIIDRAALSQASVAERPIALPPELGNGSVRHEAISYL